MKKSYYAFGQIVPDEIIEELIADGTKEEDINTEMLETLFWYEYKDNM